MSWGTEGNTPADSAAAVTPSDSTLIGPTRALYVGGAGDVTVDMQTTGSAVLFKAVPIGTVLWVRAKRVRATGTAATNIVALF